MGSKISIGIIGTGRFAKVLEALFGNNRRFNIKFSSITQAVDNQRIFAIQEVLGCDIIIPAIPISALEPWLNSNQNLINSTESVQSQIWLSVCSVMEQPEKWLYQYLTKDQQIIVSHPIFGPTSSQQGTNFSNLPWVIDKNQAMPKDSKIQVMLDHFAQSGLKIYYMSASQHDQIMARSQAVAFLFGEIGRQLKFSEADLDTVGFQYLLKNQRIYEGDSRQLLLDMFHYNRFARVMLNEITQVLHQLESEIDKPLDQSV